MLQIDRFGRIAIATVTEAPRLDATNAEPLGSQLSEYCLKYPGSHLLLDLHQIEYLSSAAITQIIKAYRELEKQGGGLRVCGVNPYPIFRSKVCSIRVFRGIACRKLLCVGAWFSF